MQHRQLAPVLASALLLTVSAVRAQEQQPAAPLPADPANTVYVTGARGQSRVPVRIAIPRGRLLASSRAGTWAGDTLVTRTPVALTLDPRAGRVSFRAEGNGAVRVTVAAPREVVPATAAGAEVTLQREEKSRELVVRRAK